MAYKKPPKETQFKKGQTGNPKGRPPVLPDLKDAIAKCLAEEKDGYTALDTILAALTRKAAKGDVRAAQELMDRGFGKAKQTVEQTVIDKRPEYIVDSEETKKALEDM